MPAFGGISPDLPQVLNTLREYFKGQPFELHGLYKETLERFKTYLPELTDFVPDRDNWDYVYDREKLATLAGRKYHGKKNHANAFFKENPNYVYEPITAANVAECIAFGDKWCERRAETDATIECEFCAIKQALNNMDVLGIKGGLIRLNGQVEAFSFGEKINPQTAVVHVEKANPNIRGLYTVINMLFAQNVFPEIPYLNREEDMGKEGLRTAKESYHPEFMVEKYNTTVK